MPTTIVDPIERNDLQVLAARLTEAHFAFEPADGVLTVRDSSGGYVEFRPAFEGPDDYRADVHGARRVLVINLITVLRVYGLTADFTFVSQEAAPTVSYVAPSTPGSDQ